MDNGGYRPEYDKYHKSNQKIFESSLRSNKQSPVRYFRDPIYDRADITNYLNWKSLNAKIQDKKNQEIEK